MQKTLFVVDDSITNLSMAEETLERNYRVITMTSAARMFEILENVMPDLILLDVAMPDMSGFEAIKQLKSSIQYSTIPVIFLTALQDSYNESYGIDLGAVDFITKPFSEAVLLHRVKLHLHTDELIKENLNRFLLADVQNKAKSEYLSKMSHEIRTPINAIIGMTAIGKASDEKKKMRYTLEKIEDASTHLLSIINDILDLSKIEAGKLELNFEDFNFENMIQETVSVVSFRMSEKKQELSVYLDKNIPTALYGDSLRISQVITNLLGNAVKFTPNGGNISLSAVLLGEANGFCNIQIEVIDSGIGISSEQQAKLFRSFEQANSNTSKNFGGTGLGLSISKNIVEMMGGKIWVESQLERGATFAFNIQIERGNAVAFVSDSETMNWKNLRMLTVDENPGILGYIQNYAEGFGAHCDTASCGSEAITLAERNDPYDVFFIDWKMTDIDALRLADYLKRLYPEKSKKIIAMVSTTGWEDIEEKASAAGIDGFLSKPLFPTAITKAINELPDASSQNASAEAAKSEISFNEKCILLAEDVEINCEIVLSVLAPTHVCIDCASNGKEAVSIFKANPDKYDLILMDIQMPVMDGLEATRMIRVQEYPSAKNIPIIAMTASVFREDIEKCLEAGMDDHIGKPLDIDEMLSKLRSYLQR